MSIIFIVRRWIDNILINTMIVYGYTCLRSIWNWLIFFNWFDNKRFEKFRIRSKIVIISGIKRIPLAKNRNSKGRKKKGEVWELCRNETDRITEFENCETVSDRVAASLPNDEMAANEDQNYTRIIESHGVIFKLFENIYFLNNIQTNNYL